EVLMHLRRPGEAEVGFRQALTLLEQLAWATPAVSALQSDLGAACHDLANVLRDRGEWAEARRLTERAIMHQRAALEGKPRSSTYRHRLSNHYHRLGSLLAWTAEKAPAEKADLLRQAEQAYRQAIAVQELLVIDYPETPADWSRLGAYYHNLATQV